MRAPGGVGAQPITGEPPALRFEVEEVGAVEFAAAPTMAFRLAITAAGPRVRSLGLNVQLRIDATARSYGERDEQRLFELFGRASDWGRNLGTLLWAQTSLVVPGFRGDTARADLAIPCTYDFEVAASKYLHALDGGHIPLLFLFSGTIFYEREGGGMLAARIPWDREARFRLPARVWTAVMDHYFPNTAWLRLRRDLFDRLNEFRTGNGYPTWDVAIDALLAGPRATAPVAVEGGPR